MTKPWEIVSTFQDQLRSKARMFASSEDLGQVQKFIAPNGSNALTLKLQKVKSVLDESVRIIEESKPPRLNLSCLSICQNHKSLDQSDITGNYKNSVDPVMLSSIFQSFEKYLEVQRQNFKSMVQQMFDLTEASCDVAYKQVCSDLIPQSSCNFQVTSTTCGTSGEAELIPRALTNDVQKSQITVGSSSTCGVTSATPSSDASCSSHINTLAGFKSKGEDLANLHNALQKSSADAISKEDEFSGVGPFDQGLVCGNFRPIRKSASKKLEGFSKCIVNTSDSSSELLVKEDVNMSTALKSTFKNQITLCSTEKENFLEDLSIMASEKSSISNLKAVVTARTSKVKTRDNTEVQQTRSGRAVKSPKQYWLCQRPEESLHEKAGFTISARSKTACAGIETLKSVAVKTAVSRKKPQAHTVSTTNSDKESRKPLETSKIIFNKEEQNTNVMEMKTKNGLPEYCDSNSGPEATKGLKSRKRKVQESKQKIVVSKPAKAVAVPKLNPAKKPRKTCKTSEQILSSEDDYLNTTGGASGEWRVVLCNLSSSEKNVNQLGGRYVTLKKHDNDKVSKMLEGKTTVRKRVLKQATCREVKNYVANENIEADPYQKERSVRAVSKGNKRSNSRRQLQCDTVKKKKLMPIEKRTGAIKNLKASSNKTVAPVACKERTKELPTYDSNSDGTFEPAFECYFQD